MAKLGQYDPSNMTEQEVFEVAATHLLEQGERSAVSEFSCMYNGPNGRCCAAAPFVQNYKPEMEEISYSALVDEFDQPGEHVDLISDLQFVHDKTSPSNWLAHLFAEAKEKGLCNKFLAKWHQQEGN